MNSGKVLLGLLAGLAAGATLGILFAPEKGKNTRRRMINQSNDYVDELKDKFNEYMEGVTEKFNKTKAEATKMAGQMKHKAEKAEHEMLDGKQ
jgi:gas vesicle protein